ncbi:MAG: hypothetical protein AAFW76_05920 [Pseudomonadota bacterium]
MEGLRRLFRLFATLAFMAALWSGPVAAGPVSGPASIAGPGLIAIDGRTLRLWGILMPGRNTSEGAIAYRQFGTLIEGRILACVPTDEVEAPVSDAICRTEEGTDIAELLVREGWALDDGPRSRGHYLNEMEEAAARRRGVWGLTQTNDVGVLSEAERPEIAAGPEEPADSEPASVSEPPPDPVSEPPLEQAGLAPPAVEPPGVESLQARPTQARPPQARPPQGAALQVASGGGAAQRSAEVARMRASYPWLFEGRVVRLVDPSEPGGRYRALVDIPQAEIADVCARLSASRESCLLISRL